jgi:Type I restriction enzyme R protein N terminus (HSDR_N)
VTSLARLSRYRFAGKSEQAVREEWIAPLLVHLGYGADTLHQISYEVPLALAKPFRRIGRLRVAVDYLPTVFGRGLWIIEAKAAESEEWDDAISQAWLYATHPEIDVPFMAIADGSRFAVYDTQQPDWDAPVVDLPVRQLDARFSELRAVLGAATLTTAVRQTRLRHLGAAMRAEIDASRLNDYVRAVEKLADDARLAVRENWRSVMADEAETRERIRQEILDEAGLLAIGAMANRPIGASRHPSALGCDVLLALEPSERRAAFARLRDGARGRSSGPDRLFWGFRMTELAIALSCRDEPGCEFLQPMITPMLRNHLLNFPEDPVGRAAHRLERVLPSVAERIVASSGLPNLRGLAREMQAEWSDERRVRSQIDGDRIYLDIVERMVKKTWRTIEWNAPALNRAADELEEQLGQLPSASPTTDGLEAAGYFQWDLERDQLEMATLYETGSLIAPEHVDDDIRRRLEVIFASDKDKTRMVDPAADLLSRCARSKGERERSE